MSLEETKSITEEGAFPGPTTKRMRQLDDALTPRGRSGRPEPTPRMKELEELLGPEDGFYSINEPCGC